jgi:hypothetical protein
VPDDAGPFDGEVKRVARAWYKSQLAPLGDVSFDLPEMFWRVAG